MTVLMKKKITPKDMNPKRLLGAAIEVRTLLLGRLLGVASGVTKSESPTGEILFGLTGAFKFNDAIDKEMEYNSGVLWLPNGFGVDVIDQIKDGEASSIRFAFDVTAVRAENPAGYEWAMTPLIKPTEDNPLASLAAEISEAAPALTDQTTKEPETAPVEAPAAKGKNREKVPA